MSLDSFTERDALRQAVAACEAEVASARAALGQRSCGQIKFNAGAIPVAYDFDTHTLRSEEIGAQQAGGNIPSFCLNKVMREGISRDLSLIDLIPIPTGVTSHHCASLVQFFRRNYAESEQMYRYYAAWQNRSSWTYKYLASRLRLLQYMISRGVSHVGRMENVVVGPEHEMRVVIQGFQYATIQADVELKTNIARELWQGIMQERGLFSKYFIFNPRDPFFLFYQSVMRSSLLFDFDRWIKGLTEYPVGHTLGAIDVSLPSFPLAAQWWEEYDSCVAHGANIAAQGLCVNAPARCATGAVYTLNGISDPVTIGAMVEGGKGNTAEVYRTSVPRLLQKVVTAKDAESCADRVRVICSERTSLRVLKGLGGHSPRQFDVTDAADPTCAQLSVFMERIPGKIPGYWLTSEASDEEALSFLAQSVGILEVLHKAGFTHNDNHDSNVVIDTTGGSLRVGLIDFGYTRPVVDKAGRPIYWNTNMAPFRQDMAMLYEIVAGRLKSIENPKLAQVSGLMLSGMFFEMPDYRAIISLIEEVIDELD